MSFLNPLLLVAALGVALPILAHLLNRNKVKRTDWAAMQFLDRSVRIRSRELRLKDFILLCLRCLAILILVAALAKPFVERLVFSKKLSFRVFFTKLLKDFIIHLDIPFLRFVETNFTVTLL